MKILHIVAFVLLIVGGLNWGLVGASLLMGSGSNWNVVHMIFGASVQLEGLVYLLVGLAALVLLADHRKCCNMCSTKDVHTPVV